LHKFTAVSNFNGVKLQFPPIQNGRQLSSQYRDYLAIPEKKIRDHTLVIRVSRLIPSVGLLEKGTCLSEAFSDQIKAPKAPKMKNKYRFYGK
jgi:hypothetical protein